MTANYFDLENKSVFVTGGTVFLASASSSMITVQLIAINGGVGMTG